MSRSTDLAIWPGRSRPLEVQSAIRLARCQLSSQPGIQSINVIGEISSVLTYKSENGGSPRVHPMQPEEIDAGTGRHTALLDWRAVGMDDRQLYPIEAIAVSGRPDDGANILLAQIQRTAWFNVDVRWR